MNEWRLVFICLSSDSLTLQEDASLSSELSEYSYRMVYQQLDTMRSKLQRVRLLLLLLYSYSMILTIITILIPRTSMNYAKRWILKQSK